MRSSQDKPVIGHHWASFGFAHPQRLRVSQHDFNQPTHLISDMEKNACSNSQHWDSPSSGYYGWPLPKQTAPPRSAPHFSTSVPARSSPSEHLPPGQRPRPPLLGPSPQMTSSPALDRIQVCVHLVRPIQSHIQTWKLVHISQIESGLDNQFFGLETGGYEPSKNSIDFSMLLFCFTRRLGYDVIYRDSLVSWPCWTILSTT